MSLALTIDAELELRRRKKAGIVLNAPERWDEWLTTLFPKYFNKPFTRRHEEFWGWVESIRPGKRPRPFVAVWGRGGSKSMSAEGAVIHIGALGIRHYVWYISSIQEKADQHVASIGGMLESSETNKYYPSLANRALNKYGNSKGWRRERLRTASGFTVDALGLDTGARGAKIDEHRPDFIVIDDVDELFDTFASTSKKMKILANSILPAGSADCAVLFIQNLITADSIASRLMDGRADFLSDRITSGPYPAIENMEYEARQTQEEGIPVQKYFITGGKATWEGQDLEICQGQIFTWGFSAFMQESQHEVDKTGGIWDHVDFQHIDYAKLPDFTRTTVWVDPAVSSTDESDSMGISAGGVTKAGKIIGLYWWEEITSPEDAIERAIKKAVEIKSLTVGIETDQGGDTWRSVYRNALEKVKQELKKTYQADFYHGIEWPHFKSVKAGGKDEETGHAYGSKVERNSKLLTQYENGQVSHMSGTHTVIEKALWRFPKKPLDIADSWFWTCWDLRHEILDWESTKNLGHVHDYKNKWEEAEQKQAGHSRWG
jgi:hypothetical protein